MTAADRGARVWLAWAEDAELRRVGSSGGFVRAMLGYMLEGGRWLERASIVRMPGRRVTVRDGGALRGRDTASVYLPVFAPVPEEADAATVLPCEPTRPGIWRFELLCHHVFAEGTCGHVRYFRGGGFPGYWEDREGGAHPYPKGLPGGMAECCRFCARDGTEDADFVCADPWHYRRGRALAEMVGDGMTLVLAQSAAARRVLAEAAGCGAIGLRPVSLEFWEMRMEKHRKRRRT